MKKEKDDTEEKQVYPSFAEYEGSAREWVFIQYYLADPSMNSGRAYKKAFPNVTAASAVTTAARVLARPQVKEYISKALQARIERLKLSPDIVVQELVSIATFDPRHAVDGNGTPIPLQDMDYQTAAAITALEYESTTKDDGGIVTKTKMKFNERRLDALKMLGQHMGMFTDKLQVAGLDGAPIELETTNISKADAAAAYMEMIKGKK